MAKPHPIILWNKICPTCKGSMAETNFYCCLKCYDNRPKEKDVNLKSFHS